MLTYDSILGNDLPEIEDFVTVDRVVYDLATPTGTEATVPFLDITIRMDTILYKTTRRYKTFYHYLAELGGIAQMIRILGVVLTFTVCRTILRADILAHALEV